VKKVCSINVAAGVDPRRLHMYAQRPSRRRPHQ
jgi:hypothetical protein